VKTEVCAPESTPGPAAYGETAMYGGDGGVVQGRGLHSFTLELNLSNPRTHS
jgi:hypothetical protein